MTVMKDFDPTRSSDDEPTVIDGVEKFLDAHGNLWSSTDISHVRTRLLETFFDHNETVQKCNPELSAADYEYVNDLMELMESEEAGEGLDPGDWIHIKGLDHILQNGFPYEIPDGVSLCGKYIEVGLCPHYAYNSDTEEMVGMLPLGVTLSVIGLCFITNDGCFIPVDDVKDEEQISLSLHGADIQLRKLEDLGQAPLELAWKKYRPVDGNAEYSLN